MDDFQCCKNKIGSQIWVRLSEYFKILKREFFKNIYRNIKNYKNNLYIYIYKKVDDKNRFFGF